MANVGYVNKEVRKMYGIPYSQLTDEQKAILHADSVRRSKLIKEREEAVLRNNLKAFEDEAKMERVLASIYRSTQQELIAQVTATIAKVEKSGGEWSYANQSALTRSRGLFEQITAELTKLGQKEQITFTQGLSNIYTDQFLRQVYELGQSIPVKANFNRLNPSLIRKTLDYPWSGAMFSDRLWQDKEILGRNLRVGLTQSMILGESTPQITDRIAKEINTSRYNAERIARTETKRVTYCAHNDVYEDTGVEELEYRVANGGKDGRACKVCLSDSGKHYKRGQEPTLPRHPNCRCVYIPVVSDEFGDNELNELTGSVRGAENYEKWREAEESKLKKEKTVTTEDKKYAEMLEELDNRYKATDLQIATLKAEHTNLDTRYRSYSSVRRGFQTPEEAGFSSKAEFDVMERELSAQLRDLQQKIDDAQADLKDILNERAYMLKAGAEKADTLKDYTVIRNTLRKNHTFDYSKYEDDLIEAIVSMDPEQIALQKAFIESNGGKSLANWKNLKPTEVFKDGAISDVRMIAKNLSIEYNEVKKLADKLPEEEIISRLCGGDLTQGSCSSLGFAYIGNCNGLDVLDFRGGESQHFFASNGNILQIAKLPKVVSVFEENYSDIKGAQALLKTLQEGKRYYLATGKHASIVRKVGDSYEYLELQSAISNGFKPFTADTLRRRFGCQRSHSMFGTKYKCTNVLIDVDSLKGNTEFEKLLGYLNTANDKQKKGGGGHEK